MRMVSGDEDSNESSSSSDERQTKLKMIGTMETRQ
jgi:hypothetical protein